MIIPDAITAAFGPRRWTLQRPGRSRRRRLQHVKPAAGMPTAEECAAMAGIGRGDQGHSTGGRGARQLRGRLEQRYGIEVAAMTTLAPGALRVDRRDGRPGLGRMQVLSCLPGQRGRGR